VPEIVRPKTPEEAVCDFCSSHDIKWVYRAHDFTVDHLNWGSHTGWAACDDCHALVENGAWEALIDRALGVFPFPVHLLSPGERRVLRAQLGALHKRFRDAKFGPPEHYIFGKE